MNWQIATSILAFLFGAKGGLFFLGLFIGGMITVSVPVVTDVMGFLASWFGSIVEMIVD
ncbi:MAG: hypothetical protein GKR90_25340 [Pseudomonadales bacterium]|nr:hypothetical protein [Pseudomonadales bacterium]